MTLELLDGSTTSLELLGIWTRLELPGSTISILELLGPIMIVSELLEGSGMTIPLELIGISGTIAELLKSPGITTALLNPIEEIPPDRINLLIARWITTTVRQE